MPQVQASPKRLQDAASQPKPVYFGSVPVPRAMTPSIAAKDHPKLKGSPTKLKIRTVSTAMGPTASSLQKVTSPSPKSTIRHAQPPSTTASSQGSLSPTKLPVAIGQTRTSMMRMALSKNSPSPTKRITKVNEVRTSLPVSPSKLPKVTAQPSTLRARKSVPQIRRVPSEKAKSQPQTVNVVKPVTHTPAATGNVCEYPTMISYPSTESGGSSEEPNWVILTPNSKHEASPPTTAIKVSEWQKATARSAEPSSDDPFEDSSSVFVNTSSVDEDSESGAVIVSEKRPSIQPEPCLRRPSGNFHECIPLALGKADLQEFPKALPTIPAPTVRHVSGKLEPVPPAQFPCTSPVKGAPAAFQEPERPKSYAEVAKTPPKKKFGWSATARPRGASLLIETHGNQGLKDLTPHSFAKVASTALPEGLNFIHLSPPKGKPIAAMPVKGSTRTAATEVVKTVPGVKTMPPENSDNLGSPRPLKLALAHTNPFDVLLNLKDSMRRGSSETLSAVDMSQLEPIKETDLVMNMAQRGPLPEEHVWSIDPQKTVRGPSRNIPAHMSGPLNGARPEGKRRLDREQRAQLKWQEQENETGMQRPQYPPQSEIQEQIQRPEPQRSRGHRHRDCSGNGSGSVQSNADPMLSQNWRALMQSHASQESRHSRHGSSDYNAAQQPQAIRPPPGLPISGPFDPICNPTGLYPALVPTAVTPAPGLVPPTVLGHNSAGVTSSGIRPSTGFNDPSIIVAVGPRNEANTQNQGRATAPDEGYLQMLRKAHQKNDQIIRQPTQPATPSKKEENFAIMRERARNREEAKQKELERRKKPAVVTSPAPASALSHGPPLRHADEGDDWILLPKPKLAAKNGNNLHVRHISNVSIGSAYTNFSDVLEEALYPTAANGPLANFDAMLRQSADRLRARKQAESATPGVAHESPTKSKIRVPATFHGHPSTEDKTSPMRKNPGNPLAKSLGAKSVHFDPAIQIMGPLLSNNGQSRKLLERSDSGCAQNHPFFESLVKGSPAGRQTEKSESEMIAEILKTGAEDIDRVVYTFKAMKKGNKKKLDRLLKALRELDSGSDRDSDGGRVESADTPHKQRAGSNLNPDAPEFSPTRATTMPRAIVPSYGTGPGQPVWIYTGPKTMPASPTRSPRKPLQENTFLTMPRTRSTHNTIVHLDEGQTTPKQQIQTIRKRVILDDPDDVACREVDILSRKYAEEYLGGFLKRYPMTGTKAQVVPKKKLEDLERERSKENLAVVLSGKVASSLGSGMSGFGVRSGWINGVPPTVPVMPGGFGVLPLQELKPKKLESSAADIQQKLELLLLKKKENKVKEMREKIMLGRTGIIGGGDVSVGQPGWVAPNHQTTTRVGMRVLSDGANYAPRNAGAAVLAVLRGEPLPVATPGGNSTAAVDGSYLGDGNDENATVNAAPKAWKERDGAPQRNPFRDISHESQASSYATVNMDLESGRREGKEGKEHQ